MFKKNKKNSTPPSASSETTIPDPWNTIEPAPHFPSPLELDRLLTQEHPLISAATPHLAISAVDSPTVLLPSPHADQSPTTSPAKVLLQNELKLPSSFEAMKTQIGNALALLYWEMNNAGMNHPDQPVT